ncbi:sensor histidine kinase [Roseobacter sp. GAI101]|uniref:sensor histidine kinase n=1 Tax=Roseobacter sp. (strain GAI101) TaxID=391589 RepID=UPI0002DD4730|nr:ATP-binding protein [Roseobacter sp. GAI101]
MASSRYTLSLQIVSSLIFVFGLSILSLIFVGHRAIKITDEAASGRQERFAARSLESAIAVLPKQQRSATVWDDAVQNVIAGNDKWMDENLGIWMQQYFGHNEDYVLAPSGEPVFASVRGEIRHTDSYSIRAKTIAPLVAQLRETMADVSAGQSNPYEELAEVAVVTPLRFENEVAIVSVVPIISETGEVVQEPGAEFLHVAIRYVDAVLAKEIGLPVELESATFTADRPSGPLAGIAVPGPSGDPLSWLVWKPEQPGTDLFLKILPVLAAVGLVSGAMWFWVVRHLLRVSIQLQASEAQARLDVVSLKQAKEAAEAADRAKMNFMSIVSHELRTPLTVILGYARLGKNLRKMPAGQRLDDLLQRQPLSAIPLKQDINELFQLFGTGMEKIERSGEHLLFLVNQLLDYAKIETGRLEVDPEICDVRKVLEPVIEQMRVLTEQKDLDLETTIVSCLMLADVTRTRQILINLIGNAIKFTDAGKVSVVVIESEEEVHINISDTGPGIEPRELEKIFEAFHQADLSGTRSAAGTGLGLSIAKELARLEGGTISVKSEVGLGSTFTLSLPKDTSPALEKAA